MKKIEFKKLAILGIVSGTVLSAQVSAAPVSTNSGTILAAGCGGGHGCHMTVSAGCNGGAAPQYYQQPSASCSQSQMSQGCGGQRQRGYTADSYSGTSNAMPRQSSCAGMPASTPSGTTTYPSNNTTTYPSSSTTTYPSSGATTYPSDMQNQQNRAMQPGQGSNYNQQNQMQQQGQMQPGQTSGYNQSSRRNQNWYVSQTETAPSQDRYMSDDRMKNQNDDSATKRMNDMNTSTPR